MSSARITNASSSTPTDIANANSKAMIEMFDRYRIPYTFTESGGGHTWINWRAYLAQMAPLLFR